MFYKNIFFLLCIVWISNGENICEERVEDICKIPEQGYSMKFPESPKEMEKLCLDAIPFGECVANYQEQCSSRSVMPLQLVQSLLKAGKTFCEKNSAWYRGAPKFGNCYESLKRNLPFDFFRNCASEIEKDSKLAYLNDTKIHTSLHSCYYSIESASCLAEKVSKDCGELAKELGLHFIREAGPWNFICQDHQSKALKLMKDLNFTFDPKTSEEEFGASLQS
ncbi:uncharacterized protein [Parasteatoda tepidariorum]|uniref:uncharacterized protein n=1 Tax=Parasteatoda tepidariorum TaxID=114398 RepID=UPI00077FC98D|nr:uncharacterized protein LOC107454637 [Parasteatoda tepidariorum]